MPSKRGVAIVAKMEQDIREYHAENAPGAVNKTRLSYWWPLLEAAGIPTPKTQMVSYTENISPLFDGTTPKGWDDLLANLTTAARFISQTGPWFLRTDFGAAKHSWKNTCFITDLNKIGAHVAAIAEDHEMQFPFAPPCDNWVVREMLPTKPIFTAFWGDMPITREFRFFVRGDEVEYAQSYWLSDAIKGNHPSKKDWRKLLAKASEFIDGGESDILYDLARRVSRAVPGVWSVDLLDTERGWFVTDMAEGDFGRNYLKRFPRYSRSTYGDSEGNAVHIVQSVEAIWWKPNVKSMIRTSRPDFNVNLRCGNAFLVREYDTAPRCEMLTGCGSGQRKCKGCWKHRGF